MCDPVTATLAVAGGAMGLYGASQQASAQKKAANAIAEQNQADIAAQTQGYAQRLADTKVQTEAQKAAWNTTMGNVNQIADTMRTTQNSALDAQASVNDAANQQEAGYRAQGQQAAGDLLDTTSAGNMQQAQMDWESNVRDLLTPYMPQGSTAVGTGDDPEVAAAVARRTAQAATNIRQWGADNAKVGSYVAPMTLVQNAITNAKTGIMPAQIASDLLQSSYPVLENPARQSWSDAGTYGAAATAAAQQAGQNALDVAGLRFQNDQGLANLQQANTEQAAANKASQATADAQFQAQMGALISGIGNLGLQGAGYYGKLPGFLTKTPVAIS
jgi:hypothetical protein